MSTEGVSPILLEHAPSLSFHFVFMEFKTINVYRKDTKSMRADLHTKNLGTVDFWRHVNGTFGLSNSELSLVSMLEQQPSRGIYSQR